MINPKQLRDLVVIPVLSALTPGESIASAVELIMGTAMQESRCGESIHQLGGGPALGLMQMEPATASDVHGWARRSAALSAALEALTIGGLSIDENLVGNLYFSVAMARLHYRRVPDPLPVAGDIMGHARYYKLHYNTLAGAATIEDYLANWHELQRHL